MATTPHNLDQVETLVGRTISKYRFLRIVGQGGMGRVYEAINTTINKRVAIKCIDAALARNAEAIERFQREALAASAIESPHIVQIFDAGEAEGVPFIVMELLRGQDLGGHITELGRLDLHEALQLTAQILKGLHHAHNAGIVHRDLKPDNVFLVDREDEPLFVKLLDFGVSKIARSEDVPLKTLTRQGTVVGTPFYMSPEQAQAFTDVDGRADVYSAGAILFECLSGRPPHTGKAYEQVIVNICMKDAPDIREHNPAVPESIARVLAKALSRERDERYASARNMLDALVDAAPSELQMGTPSSSLRKLKRRNESESPSWPGQNDPTRDSGERPRSAPALPAGSEPRSDAGSGAGGPAHADSAYDGGVGYDAGRPASQPESFVSGDGLEAPNELADTIGFDLDGEEETRIMHTEPPLAAEALPVHEVRWPMLLALGVALLLVPALYFGFASESAADAALEPEPPVAPAIDPEASGHPASAAGPERDPIATPPSALAIEGAAPQGPASSNPSALATATAPLPTAPAIAPTGVVAPAAKHHGTTATGPKPSAPPIGSPTPTATTRPAAPKARSTAGARPSASSAAEEEPQLELIEH